MNPSLHTSATPSQKPKRATAQVPKRVAADSPDTNLYASVADSRELLATGAVFRSTRLDAADMLSTDAAAALARTSRVTINAWIKSGRAIGVAHLRRGFRLPRWQFEEPVFAAIRPVSDALGSRDGWTLLRFFESPQGALDGISPRQALEQGVSAKQIAALATAEAH